MVDGSPVDGGGFEDDAYMATLRRLEEAGWSSAGGFSDSEINAGFYRADGKLPVGLVEAVDRLGIVDEQGLLLPGFELETDENTGGLVIGYEGDRDEKFDQLIDSLVTWGEELEERQTEALKREAMLALARSTAGKLTRQFASPDGAKWIERTMASNNASREVVVGELARTAVPTFMEGIEPGFTIEFLETLFAHVAQEQDELLSKEASKDEIKPQFDLLSGLNRGVQAELTMRRDVEALANPGGTSTPLDANVGQLRHLLHVGTPEEVIEFVSRTAPALARQAAERLQSSDSPEEQGQE
jgi:hypothetical protein